MILWWISALLGMASSFVEATLAQIFKEKDGDEYVGGLPYYGQKLAGNKKGVGIALAILFIIYAMLSTLFRHSMYLQQQERQSHRLLE